MECDFESQNIRNGLELQRALISDETNVLVFFCFS
jgi:hypothetical protein